ncbi:late blight resistance protein R1-A-like [Salvia splendens]|uniref:late blight resistance protein R1-A-like n=1 Tax=Salvia splendens TaxID=180675 RepID=UPI001C25E76E|nr:late blight resistance protein R1-A-like [Salvia splendens]
MAAYAALASLAQITDLNRIQNKFLFSIDAKQKVRSIHEYVTSLLSFLEDCPQKDSQRDGKMRDVAYKTEDIIESLMYLPIGNRHSTDVLEEQLRCVTEEFGLMAGQVMEDRPAAASSSSSSSSRLAPFGNDPVIGLEDDLIAMKYRLCSQPSDLQIIPIVGMGGIGKTTLARTLYNDRSIVEHFDVRAWLTVSQDYSPHRSVKMLFDSLNLSREIDESENLSLYIYQHLKWRRYLIVLDDVWETRVWDDLRNIFPASDCNGSRIMLTARELDMAPNSPPHKMRPMDDYQSWELIKQKVFPNSDCPPNLEDVGKKIAQSCTGLPLAVVLVAGLLSSVNVTPSSWEEIAENVRQVVCRGSEDVLSLSYTHLPHHLRPCFLILGGFPEDRSIVASRLIKLWVAEGFLKHEDGCCKSLEEKAEEYLEDLIKRNLVDVTSKKSDGKIKRCSLHDMIETCA